MENVFILLEYDVYERDYKVFGVFPTKERAENVKLNIVDGWVKEKQLYDTNWPSSVEGLSQEQFIKEYFDEELYILEFPFDKQLTKDEVNTILQERLYKNR